MRNIIFIVVILLGMISACSTGPTRLTAFEENSVKVVLSLEQNPDGESFMIGTFTPLDADYHLYSKDIPLEGIDGLGRPTLMVLTGSSLIQSLGELQASPNPLTEPLRPDLPELRVYPEGPVTLRLPVNLPNEQTQWQDEVVVTYMACKGNTCKKPVVGKIVPIQLDMEKLK